MVGVGAGGVWGEGGGKWGWEVGATQTRYPPDARELPAIVIELAYDGQPPVRRDMPDLDTICHGLHMRVRPSSLAHEASGW